MTIKVRYLHPAATPDHVGFIPMFLNESDPRPAKEQLHANYSHGGGWSPMEGFTLERSRLCYPGDPPLVPLAMMELRNETIVVYECSFVCITQKDGSFEVARMD